MIRVTLKLTEEEYNYFAQIIQGCLNDTIKEFEADKNYSDQCFLKSESEAKKLYAQLSEKFDFGSVL